MDMNGSWTRGATLALSLKLKDKLEKVKLERGEGDFLMGRKENR